MLFPTGSIRSWNIVLPSQVWLQLKYQTTMSSTDLRFCLPDYDPVYRTKMLYTFPELSELRDGKYISVNARLSK